MKLAHIMRVLVISPSEISGLEPHILSQLLLKNSEGWSAGCIRIPGGRSAIVLNPNHAPTRQKATIMEELSHLYLGHRGSELVIDGNRFAFRSYKKSEETAAYWVGAAALLPQTVLENARENHTSANELATHFGVSNALVSFRERITGIILSPVAAPLREHH